MNNVEPIVMFNLLNLEGKKLVISRIKQIAEISISIVYFGSPMYLYVKELLNIINDTVECVLLDDTTILPQIKRSPCLMNIIDRFNKLQKNEEIHVQNMLRRINQEPTNNA